MLSTPASRRSRLLAAVALSAALVAAACGGNGAPDGPVQEGRPRSPDKTDATPESESPERAERCEPPEPPVDPEGASAQATELNEGGGDQPRVQAVVYPRPEYKGGLWSQWGQGLALADGRFLSAIGDHAGADGNSFLFVYDPDSGRMTRFADVLSHVEHVNGAWGYGKIHGQLVEGPCNEIYFATYWGTRRGLRYRSTYRGDILFRLDPFSLELEELGTPVPEHGIPSLAGFAPEGLVYGEAANPNPNGDGDGEREGDRGAFFVFDVLDEELVFETDDQRHTGFRNILVDGDGTAYIAAEGGGLLAYEPGGNTFDDVAGRLPRGGTLRASTVPGPDGTVYGVTQDPDRFFALATDGSITDLGAAPGYTASVALHPDGDRFFFVSGAHGDAWENGAPVMAVDTETSEQTVLVELNDLAEQELDLTLGGTYSLAVDPSGELLYVGFNAGADQEEPWGEVVLVIVHL